MRCTQTVEAGSYVLGALAHAGRILSFRDGRMVRDERVAAPRDAVASLAELPRDAEREAEEAVA